MSGGMLRFVDLHRQTPEKRGAEVNRRTDFAEIYSPVLARGRRNAGEAVARSAACRSAKCTALCTTTYPTG